MGLAVAIQMDPIDTINIDADSTFALALEAQARGHALYHYLPQALTLRDGRTAGVATGGPTASPACREDATASRQSACRSPTRASTGTRPKR